MRKGIKDLANTSTLNSKESKSSSDGDKPVKYGLFAWKYRRLRQ